LGGSSEFVFKVLDFLLQLDQLSFLFVHQQVIVKNPTCRISGRSINFSLHQTINLSLEEDETLVEVFFLVAGHHEPIPIFHPVALKSEQDVLKVFKMVDI
jgi:hypothetical protein